MGWSKASRARFRWRAGRGYDDLHRLLSATNSDTPSLTQTFTYNEIGNVTYNSQIGTYTYPTAGSARPHAVSGAGSRTYQYNAIGQMTSRNGTIIQWNGNGKPSSVGNVAFTYDGVGVRLKKVSSGQTTKFVGGNYEISSTGTVTKYLVGGKQVGTSFFVHHRDHLGSIQAVTNSSGTEVRRQKHKPFGDQHSVSGSHVESKGWIGEREEETELLYLNARYYDPEIARFTSADPLITAGQGLNRYSYSANSPISFSDPSGLTPCVTITLGDIKLQEQYDAGWIIICPGRLPDDRPTAEPGQSGIPGSNIIQIPNQHQRRPQSPRAGQEREQTGCGPLGRGRCPDTSTGAGNGGTGTGGTGNDDDVPILDLDDLKVGDVLLTDAEGIVSIIQTIAGGENGHSAIVVQTGDGRITVLSADDRGTYLGNVYDPAVGGRTWEVYRVPGVDPSLVQDYASRQNLNGGYAQYFITGGTCNQVTCGALNAGLGSKAPPFWVNTSLPWHMENALGPPIGRVTIPYVNTGNGQMPHRFLNFVFNNLRPRP